MGIRDQYANNLKAAVVRMSTESVLAGLTAEVPVLLNPFLRFITKEALEALLNFLVNRGEMAAFFMYVDLRTNQQGRNFYDSVVNWQKATTPEEKAKREKEFKLRFRELVVMSS